MEAERREALRLKTKSGNSVPVRNVMITADELRALLARDEAMDRVEVLHGKAEMLARLATDPVAQQVHGWYRDDLSEALGRD